MVFKQDSSSFFNRCNFIIIFNIMLFLVRVIFMARYDNCTLFLKILLFIISKNAANFPEFALKPVDYIRY